ncbi:MAG: hypothetical protein KDH20_09760, partial [Rhodocyclaceae bacterium]|nr:hypothetical protein [Rhodocyclaceae bacterium]
MNAPLPERPDLDQLAPEWERLQLLAFFAGQGRAGQAVADDDLTRLRALQQQVETLRGPEGPWQRWLGLALEPVEWDALVAVLAPEFEPRIGWAYQQLQGGGREPWPSRALIHELLALEPSQGEALRHALAPGATLARRRLLQPADDGWQPLQPDAALLARLGGHHRPLPPP